MEKKNSILCIGLILDGNRRWARERNLTTFEGHREGYKRLKDAIEWCKEAGIKHVVSYVFSTENWNRSKEEVGYLMDLIRTALIKDLSTTRKDTMAIHIIGDTELFPEDIQQSIRDMHESNPKNATYHLWLAASYGGRREIVAGVNSLLKEGKGNVNEEEFKQALWSKDMPDPDIIIRTGGEKRLSNFITWGSVYSELFFLDTYWPAFSREDFDAVLNEYHERERRHGK